MAQSISRLKEMFWNFIWPWLVDALLKEPRLAQPWQILLSFTLPFIIFANGKQAHIDHNFKAGWTRRRQTKLDQTFIVKVKLHKYKIRLNWKWLTKALALFRWGILYGDNKLNSAWPLWRNGTKHFKIERNVLKFLMTLTCWCAAEWAKASTAMVNVAGI